MAMHKSLLPGLLLLGLLLGCSPDTDMVSGAHRVFDPTQSREQSRLDHYIQDHFASPKRYNVSIRYRYDDSNTDRRFLLAPALGNKVLEYLNVMDFLFFGSYSSAAPKGYLEEHTIKYLTLFGSSGYGIDRKMQGAAPQGEIWIYDLNNLDVSNIATLRSDYISVLFHESAHTLHEERAYPPAYDKFSSLDYQKQDAFLYWGRTGQSYLKAGFVSSYASTDPDEDFAELFATYLLDSDEEWAAKLAEADGRNRNDAVNTGKQILEAKLGIMRTYLRSNYQTELDVLRAEVQRRLALLPTMDFTQYPSGY